MSHLTGLDKRSWILIPAVVLMIICIHLVGINFLAGWTSYLPVAILLMAAIVAWHAGLFRWIRGQGARAERQYNEADVLSRNGIHWHPEISIYVKGVKQEIPHMGISDMDMSAMHKMHSKMQTQHLHEGPNDQGIVHLKFQGVVLKSDIMLGQVFKKMGKNTRSFGANLKMTVNGKENSEYEIYVMQDKDKIELRYE